MRLSRLFMPFLLLMIIGCKRTGSDYKETFSDPVLYCKTVKQLNNVVLENNFPPMIGSRNYAYANIAAYECVAAGDTNYRSLSGQLKELPPMPASLRTEDHIVRGCQSQVWLVDEVHDGKLSFSRLYQL